MKIIPFLRKHSWLADLAALAGFLAYAALLWQVTRIQYSVLDEGLYLYKGWLLATGKYIPFQDNGLWMNQMPLSFWIPGWIELIFGPGLRTGRAFAFVLGLLALPALWLTARREGNRWVAAALVWAVALNPAAARISAMAASQGLVAFLLAWTMFLTLGHDRRPWQLFLGGLLAGVVVMVRINMLPLLPLLALYVIWEHWPEATGGQPAGKSLHTPAITNGAWLLAGMLIIFIGVHMLYWPNILRLWAKWLPLPFLKPWFPPPNTQTWNPDNPLAFRVASFFLGFRYHFAAMAGAGVTLILWGKGKDERAKKIVFLTALFFLLILLHAWAALGNEYCVFCFPTYTTFYSGIGLLLTAISIPAWRLDRRDWRKPAGALFVLALMAGMAYSAEGTAESLLGETFYKRMLSVPVPGLDGAAIWQVIANKFGLAYETIFDATHTWFPVTVAVVFGLVILSAGILFLGRKNSEASGAGFALFLLIGVLLSPSPLLAGEYQSYDCKKDVIAGYENAGLELAKVIRPGAKVYWAGYSPVTLLYLPDVSILPGQLHGTYSFRISNDDAAIRRYGWWNQSLAEKWLAEADFVLLDVRNLDRNDWLGEQLLSDRFKLVLQTKPQSCLAESAMLVYQKKLTPRARPPKGRLLIDGDLWIYQLSSPSITKWKACPFCTRQSIRP